MKFKRLIAAVSAAAMSGLCVLSNLCTVSAADYGTHSMGLKPVTESDVNNFYSQFDSTSRIVISQSIINSTPTSCDLSSSSHPDHIYFPPVGNQGSVNSCTAWATTYYQYTYAANKHNEIPTTASNAYSPSWTYNYINQGVDSGAFWYDAYNVLLNQGALTLAEMPYNGSNYSMAWSTNTSAMMNALKTRIARIGKAEISATGTPITSKTDSDLNYAKALISTGHILEANIQSMGSCSYKSRYGNSSEKVIYRAASGSGGHAVAVVGYDNNVCCDVNGNGTIEDSERGAFKIVNSWGSSWGNNGYIWVLYDALNAVSNNKTNNWQSSESGTRMPIFKYYTGENVFNAIEVENYNVNMAGLLTVNTTQRNTLSVDLFRNTTGALNTGDEITYFDKNGASMSDRSRNLSFNGSIVLDYSSLANPVNVCTTGYYYGVNVDNRFISSGYGTTMTNVTFKIIDDKFNVIKDFRDLLNMPTTIKNGYNSKYCTKVKFDKGDVNYDGRISANDSDTVLNYVAEKISLSSLQKYLADFNNDGVVNVSDVVAINSYINSHSSSSSELQKVQEINERVIQIMEDSGYSQSEIDEVQEMNTEIQQQIQIIETNCETE